MTEKVKYAALTPITSDSQLRQAVNNLIMNLAPLTGQHPEKGNQALTWLDFAAAGYEFRVGADGSLLLPPPVAPESPDMSTPPELTQFSVVASFNYVTFSWGQPAYKNHSHVEIWRAPAFKTSGTGPNVPTVLGDAVFRLMSSSVVASDTVLPADQWRYWARNISKTGVAGPWSSIDGTLVSVPEDPAYLIDKISGEIRESDLYKDLGAKIDGSDKGVKSLQQLTNSSYTVKIDSGNAVSGFGIMADATGRSNFIIRSDKFAIAAPQQYDQSGKPVVNDDAFPFIVDVTNPAAPRTLIKNAYIDQAFIQNLVTGSLVADRITGQTLVGTHIRGGDMAIGSNFNVDTAGSATMLNAFIKGTMQSSNYATGSAGWQIHNSGNSEFNNAVVRGTVYAEGGYFKGTVYVENLIGDVVRVYSMYSGAPIAIPAMNFTRNVVFSIAVNAGEQWGQADVYVDGGLVGSVYVSAMGVGVGGVGTNVKFGTVSVNLSAGVPHTIAYVASGGNISSSSCMAVVAKN